MQLLRQEPGVDLLLCDVMMPIQSGIALYRDIERELPGLAPRVVFMTGGAIGEEAAAFLEQTHNLKLEKPFDLNDILQLFSRLNG
jgi:CheY-like chemotaxis protein